MTVTADRADVAGPEAEAAEGAGGSPEGLHAGRLGTTRWLPPVLLVVVSVVIFGGTYLVTGHPLLIGDNLIQNYPLRVLAGTDLRHGVAPTWDPWISDGTPLMAGLNAGAFYPATWLFALMPAALAWVLGQILLASATSLGAYAFLRASGVRSLGAFLGAFTFAFAGAVAAQSSVHIDMAEGLASLPWVLLAIRRISDDGRWRWAFLLGGAFALLILSGSPEAMLDISALGAAYTICRVVLGPQSWWQLVSRGAAAIAAAVAVTAFLWIPALHFISISQRAGASLLFVSSWSFPPKAFVLGVVPYLEGGWGMLNQPGYNGPSDLPEVAFYVGMLPLVALVALAGRRWKDRLPRGERLTWYVIAAVGIILAIASGGPLEHIIIHIPVYGRQRDQGRNIVTFDFAAAVLLAWWVDGGYDRARAGAGTTAVTARATALTAGATSVTASSGGAVEPASSVAHPQAHERSRPIAETIGAIVVPAIVLALVIWLLVSPSSLWREIGMYPPPHDELGSLDVGGVIAAVLALGAGAVVFARRRLPPAAWHKLVTAFVVADVGLFASGISFSGTLPAPSAASPGPVAPLIAKALAPGGGNGRYAVFDPDLYYPNNMVVAEQANVGILTRLPSVQGYGAIVDAAYADDTDTHSRGNLDTDALQLGYFRALGLEAMATPAESLIVPVASLPTSSAMPRVLKEQPGTDPILRAGNVPPPAEQLPVLPRSGPRPSMEPGQSTGWFFGALVSPATVVLQLSSPAAGQTVRAGGIGPDGAVTWAAPQRLARGTTAITLKGLSSPAVGAMVELVSGPELPPSELAFSADGHDYVADGALSGGMRPTVWSYIGEAADFSVFRLDHLPVPAWLQTGFGPGQPSSTGQVSIDTETATSAKIDVDSPTARTLVRSEAWDPGWSATVQAGGRSYPANVRQVGVLQGVAVPAGTSTVSFTYKPPGWHKGLAIAAAGALAVIVASLASAVYRRRRRRALDPKANEEPEPQAAGVTP